jgi:hypothetical protein
LYYGNVGIPLLQVRDARCQKAAGHDLPMAGWVAVIICVGVIAIAVPLWHRIGVWKAYGKVARDMRGIASRHFLTLGIILFFLSRLIAFYGSAVKAGLLG